MIPAPGAARGVIVKLAPFATAASVAVSGSAWTYATSAAAGVGAYAAAGPQAELVEIVDVEMLDFGEGKRRKIDTKRYENEDQHLQDLRRRDRLPRLTDEQAQAAVDPLNDVEGATIQDVDEATFMVIPHYQMVRGIRWARTLSFRRFWS